MEDLLERLLDYYHLSHDDYELLNIPVDETNFAKGHSFKDMEKCVALVKEMVESKKKIFIYGDYDCDGIMAISILVKMFSYLDYPVDYYVPSRYIDGYGLTLKKSQEIVENGYDLLITVDNGVTAFEGIEYAKNHGLKVLVFDHHQPEEKLPIADYILHPSISHFGDVPSSAGFVTFMFTLNYLGRFDQYLATLAAISVVSDMMPLLSYNRHFLRLVFGLYQKHSFYNIDLLKEKEVFNETSIGMRIGPKINAIGRLMEKEEDLSKTVKFFTSTDKELLLNYNDWINDINNQRKEITKFAAEDTKDIETDQPAIVGIINQKEGVIGLIANTLVKKYNKPTIIFALDASGEFYKGSCRAPQGFNVVDTFNKLNQYLVTSGGHALAGGCTIKVADYESFKEAFNQEAAKFSPSKEEKHVIDLYINEISRENYDLVNSFSPFGENWPAPLFKLSRIRASSLLFSRDCQHITTTIGNSTKLTGFNFPKEKVSVYQYIDMIGTLRLSVYYGKTSVDFLINEINESKR